MANRQKEKEISLGIGRRLLGKIFVIIQRIVCSEAKVCKQVRRVKQRMKINDRRDEKGKSKECHGR